ncbi:MAG: 2-amino-4-hydroxy-6-hydroxymethyldihydropteridine diphosphokinase [Bilophila sp.]
MQRHRAIISMGSNLGNPEENLALARERLRDMPGLALTGASPVYFTEPQDMRDQPWFANQVLRITCPEDMTATAFLAMLLELENAMGRKRAYLPESSETAAKNAVPSPAERYGPRVIDLDLLFFDAEQHATPHLTLPHPRILERAFVLVPLRDLEPNLILPGGQTPGEVLRSLAHAVDGNRIRQ